MKFARFSSFIASLNLAVFSESLLTVFKVKLFAHLKPFTAVFIPFFVRFLTVST